MEMRELCARNLSASLREAQNARLAAMAGGVPDDLTGDLIDRACELLGRAASRVAVAPAASTPPMPPAPPAATDPRPPEPSPSPVPKVPVAPADTAKAPAQA